MAEFGCDRQISGVSAIELKKHNVKGFIFKILKFTFVYECFAYMYICVFRDRAPGTGVRDGCVPPWGRWEPDLRPLQEC